MSELLFDGYRDHHNEAGRRQLLEMYELRRRVERGAVANGSVQGVSMALRPARIVRERLESIAPVIAVEPPTSSGARCAVIQRPPGVGTFQFVVLATLRAAQLMRGCRARVDGEHKATVMAQLEVSEGKVMQALTTLDSKSEPTAIGTVSEDAPALVHTI